MASFKIFSSGGRRHSKGSNSRSERLEPPKGCNNVDDDIYLPGSNSVYITKTKSGKPALARKRHDRLLDDFEPGPFDQSIDTPSRADVEKRARRYRSFYSQNQGLASPLTPRRSTTPQVTFDNHGKYRGYGTSPTVMAGNGILRSASISPPERIYRVNESPGTIDMFQDKAFGAKGASQVSANASLPTQPIPMAPPLHSSISPSQPRSTWNLRGDANGILTMDPIRGPPVVLPTYPGGYTTTQLPDYGGLRSLGQRKSPGVATAPQYVLNPIHMAPWPNSTPSCIQPRQYTSLFPVSQSPAFTLFGSTQAPLPAYPLTPVTPMTPTTPSSSLPHGGSSKAASSSTVKFSPREAEKFEEHYTSTVNPSAQETNTIKAKGNKGATAMEDIACGKKRSRGYQREHPLKRGQIPDRDYCHKCLRHTTPAKYVSREGIMRRTGYETADSISDDKPMDAKTWRSRKLKRRAARTNLASKISSQQATRGDDAGLPFVSAPIPILNPRKYRSRNRRAASKKEPLNKDDTDPFVSELEVSRAHRKRPLKENNNSTSMSAVRTNDPRETGDLESKKLAEPFSEFSQHDSSGNASANSIEIPSQVTTRGRRVVSETVPEVRTRGVPTLSEAGSLKSDTQDNMYKKMDEDFERLSFHDGVKEFKKRYSNLNLNNSFIEQPVEKTHDLAEKYKTTRERKPEMHRQTGEQYYSGAIQESHGSTSHTAEAEPETPHTPMWPSTPNSTEMPYAGAASIPIFTDDYWGVGEEDDNRDENNARELAEEELASAGKLFDDYASAHWGSSRTASVFAPPAFVTRTEISVESLRSGEGQNRATADTSTVTYRLADTSDTGEDVDWRRPTGTTGTSRKNNRDRARKWMPPTYYDTWQRPDQSIGQNASKKQPNNNIYHFDERESSSSLDPLPPDPVSSVVGHTGHSTEDMPPSMFDYDQPTTGGGWRSRFLSRH
ncbi:uncharacterized protein F4812DRAFT_471481 [Daldinia caldariorum]|uniref:uncharacterized protein n=1 Tax=Daldinia caldariorum TaxID=326644 RepID=UPI002007C5B0|nr:uncharacterized protein F4812DRAFT_471481 [Daldinia caldariorum]KAI1467398.1 hypothetical protein F4812DRAFT_471481 [Daldinia caldariorum]